MSALVSPRTRRSLQNQSAPNSTTLGPFVRGLVPTSLGAATVRLPSPAAEGTVNYVSDNDGQANTNPITVDGNGALIDGSATLVLSTANVEGAFVFDGGQWRRILPVRIFDTGDPFVRFVDVPASEAIAASDFQFSHIVNATAAGSFFALLTLLIARGWAKTQDSDGTTYSANGTRITHAGAGANGLNNANAWFVVRMPGSNRALCFQRGASPTVWRISYCADNAFTAGAPAAARIAEPAAGSIEVVLIGAGTAAAPTFAGQFAQVDGGYTFHCVVGGPSSGYAFACWAEDNGTRFMSSAMLLDALRGYGPSDPDPYVPGCAGTGAPNFSAFVNTNSRGFAWFGPLNNAANARACGVRSYGMGADAIGVSGFSAKDTLTPCFWVRNAVTMGAKGWSTLLQFTSVLTRANMTTVSDGALRNKISLTNGASQPLVLPWDGTNPGVATVDAETVGLIIPA
jgi:hypothetical protein